MSRGWPQNVGPRHAWQLVSIGFTRSVGRIMANKTGLATYRRGKLYFDEAGWAIVKAEAKKARKSPLQVVIAGLERGVKLEKAKNA